MTDRDWDKELAKIDKQLGSLSDEALLTPKAVVPAGKPVSGKAAAKAPAAAGPAPSKAVPVIRAWAVYARLLLALALGVGIVFWPYDAQCGLGLAAHLAAAGVVVAGGIWSSMWTWRHRASKAHTLSLLIIIWGLVLGSIDVLPRIGYAKPNTWHPAAWACK